MSLLNRAAFVVVAVILAVFALSAGSAKAYETLPGFRVINLRVTPNSFPVGDKVTYLSTSTEQQGALFYFRIENAPSSRVEAKMQIRHVPHRKPNPGAEEQPTAFTRQLSTGLRAVLFTGIFPEGKIYRPGKYSVTVRAFAGEYATQKVTTTFQITE